jgi:ferredoxin-NADP reductase
VVLRVSSVRRASPSTRIVRLSLDGTEFPYKAGQAARVGVADREERVPYSIASAPEETRAQGALEFLIKVEPSGRWGHLFDRLGRGMRLGVSDAFGSFVFPDHPAERSFLFIAGGTGIAPMRSMIRHAQLAGVPGRLRLLYSARSPADFAYLPELRGMARRKEIEVWVTATRGDVPGTWRGARGRINASHVRPLVDNEPTLCFVCGPTSMVEAVPRLLLELGVPKEKIRLEEW